MYPEMIDHQVDLQHIYLSLDIIADHKAEIGKFIYK